MKNTLVPGVSAEISHRIVTENLVSFHLRDMPPVLSTPCLLDVMERAAYEAIRPHLDPGEASVGTRVQFEHVAPTPCGDTVVATARVTTVDGKQITLEFEARDSHEPIARGTHGRAIVDVDRMKRRVKRKAP